jgi:hypothetical protein
MTKEDSITWLSMKEVIEQTKMSQTTINRYKSLFKDYIKYRMNPSKNLQFDSRCVPVLCKIYEYYNNFGEGRVTTDMVREKMQEEYGIIVQPLNRTASAAPPRHTIVAATEPPAKSNPKKELARFNALIEVLENQNSRITNLETQNRILQQKQDQILESQVSMQKIMNRHLDMLSDLSRAKMEIQKQKYEESTFLSKLKSHLGLSTKKTTPEQNP